ncbi:AAA family ATPase [Clostridiaceae bacterium 35-E11]
MMVKLFHTPAIFKNNTSILLPFRKAEALFYYLSVNKHATRDELVNLLWGELDEERAKKNLRNTMYKIRKAFDMDIIISPQKHMVVLNPEIEIETDVDQFLYHENGQTTCYSGEFLQGFLLKDGEKFEEWMFHKRQYFKDIYMKRLYHKINDSFEKNNLNVIKQYADLLISIDELEERPYRILMKLYMLQGSYQKAMEVYRRLSKILHKELSIMPSKETKDLFEEILAIRSEKKVAKKKLYENFFYGRHQELQLLKMNYQRFMKNEKTKFMLIMGEAGIGKTKLKDQFLDSINQEPLYVMHANCYQAEEDYILKPWNGIFAEISDILVKEKIEIPVSWQKIINYLFPAFQTDNTVSNIDSVESLDRLKYQAAEEVVMGILRKISQKKKLLFVFEDLHWIDTMSLSLLNSILMHQENNKILFVGTYRNGYDRKMEAYIAQWTRYDKIEKIYIPRFTKGEVEDFVLKALPNHRDTSICIDRIYCETEGNTFFLVEYLNCIREKRNIGKGTGCLKISPKMEDILKSRIVDISAEGKKMLHICALFFDKVTIETLKELSGKDELEIIDITEELQDKNLLKETKDGEKAAFEFTHQKLREFIYLQQSIARRQILHHKIADLLAKRLKNDKRDTLLYSKLIYHYGNGGNMIAALQYMIKNTKFYLDFDHEFFPILYTDNTETEKYVYISDEESRKQLKDIETLLDKLKKKRLYGEIVQLQIEFFHMKGRYLIKEGKYEEGIKYIQEMIEKALATYSYEDALKGYKQMIYYYRQIHDIERMAYFVEQALNMAITYHKQEQEGVFLRLKGLNKLMAGKYEEAENLLQQSIQKFHAIGKMEDKYALNIAAAYNYIGEIKRQKMQFSEALQYYNRAIRICEDKKVSQGSYMFLTNAGQTAFEMGDYEKAIEYFQNAMNIYDQIDVVWGRSIAEGYMALLLVKQGTYKEALNFIRKAEEDAIKIKSPYALGVLYKVKTEIRANMDHDQVLKKVFCRYLNLSSEQYCNRAISYLEKIQNSYEVEDLKYFKKSSYSQII